MSIERDDIQPDHWDEGELPPPDKSIVRAYMVADPRAEAARLEIDAALAAYGLPPAVYQRVDDQDWAEAWKAHYPHNPDWPPVRRAAGVGGLYA
ncbi:MAG: hypothetical protein HND48_15480 [Chloroflexi bacterium]|nr:hypothetical protein [Chloroflexota bacterium]